MNDQPQDQAQEEARRNLPGVGKLIEMLAGGEYGEFAPSAREELTELAREAVARAREALASGARQTAPSAAQLCAEAARVFAARRRPRLWRAINATGILLHTGLGRAVLAAPAAEAVARAGAAPCLLELDAETGERGDRLQVVEDLLCHLTGAEAAALAGNNAGATLLVLTALCAGREVIVSRGHLVEIGGAFRLPDVMAQSGAVMREVGTTNKTHLRDYAQALNERTAALLFVHPSNYRVIGFHEEVELEKLVALGREKGVPVLHDLGSGALLDLRQFGLEPEPLVPDSVRAGAGLAFFSGDKLIGGPQSGIVVGKRELVQRIRKHPLARALRAGKLTHAGLEATLRLFLDRERLLAEHPLYRALARDPAELRQEALRLAAALDGQETLAARACESRAQLGSGSLPGQEIPSWAVALTHTVLGDEALARRLRRGEVAVVSRREKGEVLLDLRSLGAGEAEELAVLVPAAVRPGGGCRGC